jgi:3-methyladenine DNA glycosylase AlkD
VENFETMVKKSATTKSRSVSRDEPERKLSDVENAIAVELSALSHPNVSAIREVRRRFSKQLAKTSPEWIVALALRIARRPDIAPRFFAYELIQHHKPALKSLNADSLEALGQGNDSWEKVDTFASYLAGPVWREGQVADKLIERWARSQDRWWRRAALVSTVPLNNKARGGRGDAQRTLRICEMLVEDRDDMVVKALSWALRELSKRDSKSVHKFLQEHVDALAPRVVREVKNKLQTGLKNPRAE